MGYGYFLISNKMRIGIVSVNSNPAGIYTNKRLSEEARALGHKVVFINPLNSHLSLSSFGQKVVFAKKTKRVGNKMGTTGGHLKTPDILISRLGSTAPYYALATVAQFDAISNLTVLNTATAIDRTKNKLRSLQILTRRGVPIPRTIITRSPEDIDWAIDEVGGTPVILKLLEGTQGIGVMLAETRKTVKSVLSTLWNLGQNIIVQEYLRPTGKRTSDIRVFVIGGKVVATMKRTAALDDEFRSNIHRGGKGTQYRLTREQKQIALDAVDALKLDIAGVDMMETRGGQTVVLEVNTSPGLEGIEKATKINVAKKIIEYGIEKYKKDWGK